MLLSVLATVPSGLDVLPWIVLILTIVKVARKADAIVTRIGLNPLSPATLWEEDSPGTLTYMVVRSAASQITKAVGKSAGNGGKGAAPNAPSGGPAWRAQRRSWQHGGVCPAKRSAAKQHKSKAHHRNRLMRKAPQYIQARRNHPRRKSPPHLLRRTVCLKIRQRQGLAGTEKFCSSRHTPLSDTYQGCNKDTACRCAECIRQTRYGRKSWRFGTPQCGGSGRDSSKRRALPSLAAHESTFARDNAARPCRNVGSTIRFPYESDKLTKGTGWSTVSQVTQAAEHTGITVGQTTKNTLQDNSPRPAAGIGGAMLTTASVRGGIQTVQQHTPNARYTQRPPKQPTGQASPPRAESPHPGTAGMQKRRFCAAAVWRTATRQEWYSKPHGSFSGCTAA